MISIPLRSPSCPVVRSERTRVLTAANRIVFTRIVRYVGAGLIVWGTFAWLSGSVRTRLARKQALPGYPPDRAMYEWQGYYRVAPIG